MDGLYNLLPSSLSHDGMTFEGILPRRRWEPKASGMRLWCDIFRWRCVDAGFVSAQNVRPLGLMRRSTRGVGCRPQDAYSSQDATFTCIGLLQLVSLDWTGKTSRRMLLQLRLCLPKDWLYCHLHLRRSRQHSSRRNLGDPKLNTLSLATQEVGDISEASPYLPQLSARRQ